MAHPLFHRNDDRAHRPGARKPFSIDGGPNRGGAVGPIAKLRRERLFPRGNIESTYVETRH